MRALAPGTVEAPAPPDSRVPEHMQPMYSSTPIPNSALAAMHSASQRGGEVPALASVPEDRASNDAPKQKRASQPSTTELMGIGFGSIGYAMAQLEQRNRKLEAKAKSNRAYKPLALITSMCVRALGPVPAIGSAVSAEPWKALALLLAIGVGGEHLLPRVRPIIQRC